MGAGGFGNGGVATGGFSTGGDVIGSGGMAEVEAILPATLEPIPLAMEFEVVFSAPTIGTGLDFEVIAGSLPDGVELMSDGTLSGVPDEPGVFQFRILATNGRGDGVLGDFELIVEKQRFLAARHFVSTASTTTTVSVYDLEQGGKVQAPHLDAGYRSMTSMSPDGKWLVFSTDAGEADLENIYATYLGNGLGSLSSTFLMTGETPECEFHARGWGLACAIGGAPAVLSLYSLDDEVLALERQVAGGRFFGFRDNHSVFFEQGDQLSAIAWPEPPPGELTNFRIVKTYDVSPTGDRAIGEWKDEGRVLGITIFDLPGWYSANLISAWFSADPGFRHVETWDCPEGEPCTRRIHYMSSEGEIEGLLSESTEGWANPGGMLYHEFAPGVRVFPRSDGILVDFLTETTATRDVILPRHGGLLGAVDLSKDGGMLAWQETGGVDGNRSYLARIENGQISDPIDLGDVLFGFSPSGKRLRLHSYSANGSGQLIVLDVQDGAMREVADVGLPLEWVQSKWSRDESHIAIIGGNTVAGRRELYVVDLWDEVPRAELLEYCPPSTEGEPRCPSSVVF